MADISLIKINKTNEIYDLKDVEARRMASAATQSIANIKDGTTIDSFGDVETALNNKVDTSSLGTAAAKDVPLGSNPAGADEVVKGNDPRLTDARNAADVSAWAKAASKPTYTANEVGAIASTEKGVNSGVATLDEHGRVPASQLPSYVDEVQEYANKASFPVTGVGDIIYVDISTGKTYRWSGSEYIELNTYDEATQGSSGLMSKNDKIKLDGIEANAKANVQSDWNEADDSSDAYIRNKPSIAQIKQYSVVLDKDAWVTGQGDLSYTLSIPTLKCGNDGSVAPIITPISNIEEYSTIASATATVGTGIVFVAPVKPTKDIGIIVQDVG